MAARLGPPYDYDYELPPRSSFCGASFEDDFPFFPHNCSAAGVVVLVVGTQVGARYAVMNHRQTIHNPNLEMAIPWQSTVCLVPSFSTDDGLGRMIPATTDPVVVPESRSRASYLTRLTARLRHP